MAQLRQTSFARGEFSPLLWGRSDLEIYGAGLRRCRDFFPTKHGALMTRPGTVHLGSAWPAGKLVPFVFSDTTAYVLHFAPSASGTISVYKGGVKVATVTGTPYRTAITLAGLRFVQSGNVLTITCRGIAPHTLTRISDTVWTLAPMDFTRPAPQFEAKLKTPLPVGDEEHPDREWSYVVTMLRRDERGRVFETAPSKVVRLTDNTPVPAKFPVGPERPVAFQIYSTGPWDPTTDPMASDPGFVGVVVYRGRGGLFGLVGHSDSGDFTDVMVEPDYAVAPPQGRVPFVEYEHPRSVAYFEERLVFGGTGATNVSAEGKAAPNRLLFSATGHYLDFDERFVPVATQALMYELASRRYEEIQHLLALHQLLVFTSSSVWAFGGQDPLSPEVVPYARVQEEIGCTDVPPLTLAGAALYVRNKGAGIRALRFEQERAGFVGEDLSSIADHLFRSTSEDYRIIDWCYAEDPWGVVWAVRADGKVVSLTYSPVDNQWGWALHDFGGKVLAICSIPENGEDAVYMVVQRSNVYGTSGYFSLERMASRVQRGTTDDDICLDFAHKYEGPPTQSILIPGLAGRDDVWVVGKDNPPIGPLRMDSDRVELPDLPVANKGANVVLWVGFGYQPEIETLDAAPGQIRAQQKTVTEVVFEVDNSRGLHVGSSLDDLTEWNQREVVTGYGLPSNATEVVRTHVSGTWGIGGRAALRQTLPLPVTLVGLTREVDVGS